MDDDRYEYKYFPVDVFGSGTEKETADQLERYKHMYDDLGFQFDGEVETDTDDPNTKQKVYQYRKLKV